MRLNLLRLVSAGGAFVLFWGVFLAVSPASTEVPTIYGGQVGTECIEQEDPCPECPPHFVE